jgi:hypothetical protein
MSALGFPGKPTRVSWRGGVGTEVLAVERAAAGAAAGADAGVDAGVDAGADADLGAEPDVPVALAVPDVGLAPEEPATRRTNATSVPTTAGLAAALRRCGIRARIGARSRPRAGARRAGSAGQVVANPLSYSESRMIGLCEGHVGASHAGGPIAVAHLPGGRPPPW